MPYRKRRVQRKRRVARKPRRRMMNRQGVINVSRKCPEQNIYNNAVAGTATGSGAVVLIGAPFQTPAFAGSPYYNIPFSAEVQLADLINHTDFTGIADKYKIKKVDIKVYATSNTASAGGAAQLPSILFSTDEDDAAIPASTTLGLNTIREKMGSKYRQFKMNGGGVNLSYKPRIAGGVLNAAAAMVGAQVVPAPFLNCTFDTIPHYGIKGYLQDVNLLATPAAYTQFKFDVTVHLTLRDIQ